MPAMPATDPATLLPLVLLASFLAAMAFGSLAHRTHFCTMGALADIASMDDWSRMRAWVAAIAVAIAGFNLMVGLGWVQADKSIYAGPRVAWLSLLSGGLMFGFGMVIASGCGSRNLVRLGGGNLKSLVVLIVMAISAFATLRGITAVIRVATLDRVAVTLPVSQDLPSLLGTIWQRPAAAIAPWLGAAVAGVLGAWVLARREGRQPRVWLGGAGIGALIVLFWWISGCLGHLAEDPNTLEEAFIGTNSRRMESLSMVAPPAYALDWLLFFSDRSKTLTLGIVAMAGVVVGAALSSWLDGSFRWQAFSGVDDMAHHLVGAVMMGTGGVTALGCTVGQGLSGISTLSVGSALALAGIVGGGWLGLKYQMARLERMA